MEYNEFKRNILPELSKITSFKGKIDYLNQTLSKIGSGSGRVVFDIDNNTVLKLAKNSKGVAQNDVESGIGRYSDTHHIVTKIIDSADDDSWVIAEKAKKVTEKRIMELTGIPSLMILSFYLKNWIAENNGDEKYFHIESEVNDELDNNEFVIDLTNFIANYNQSVGDLNRASTYGEVLHDGQPTIVLTDYGLNDEVYDTYYNPKRKNRMYELYNFADGNDDILSDIGNTGEIRHGMWAQLPYSVSDVDGVVNEEFVHFVLNRDYYPKRALPSMPIMVEAFHECVNNIKKYINHSPNKKRFYENLLKLQEHLILNHAYDRDTLGEITTKIEKIGIDEDGSALYSFNDAIGQDNFSKYNPIDTSPSIQNDLNANINIEERVLSAMKGSSAIDVKKKCRLGGLGNTSVACNQGDIKNFNIKSINEEIDASEAYSDKGALQTIIDGKRNVGIYPTYYKPDIENDLKNSGLNLIPVKQIHHDINMYVIYSDAGKNDAIKLYNFMVKKGGYLKDESPIEAYYIGKLLGYTDESISPFILKNIKSRHYKHASEYTINDIPHQIQKYFKNYFNVNDDTSNNFSNFAKNTEINNTEMNETEILSLEELPFKRDVEFLGGKVFSVGGAVRDKFLGKESKDLDVLITGVPMDKLESLLSKYGKVDAVGKSFGVLKFKPTGSSEDIDIAIPRTEKATGVGGHKGFEVSSDHTLPIEMDLSRRDFTINSIAKDSDGNLIDPYGGQEDLKNKIIRVVNPEAFSEDPLRMLRATQFSSRFGFIIEPETMKLIQNNVDRIKEIPPERILTEFDKIVKKGNIRIGAQSLKDTGLFNQIFGFEIKQSTLDRSPFEDVTTMGEFIYLLTRLLNNPAEFYKNNLRGDIDTFKEIKALEQAFDDRINNPVASRSIAHNMYVISPKSLESKIILNAVVIASQELLSGKYPKTINELAVNGNDLMALGLKGKEIGDTQKSLLLKIYADKLKNDKDELLSSLQNKEVSDVKLDEVKKYTPNVYDGESFYFDPNTITDAKWQVITNYLTKMGWASRPYTQWKDYFIKYGAMTIPNDKLSANDSNDASKIIAIKKAITPREAPSEEKSYIRKAKRTFGITDNYKLAGYLLLDGTMLDFSGRRHGYNYATSLWLGYEDHREIKVIGVDMIEFMSMGNIRLKLNRFELTQMPTKEQIKTLWKIINQINDDIEIDFGIKNSYEYEYSVSYPKGIDSRRILNDILIYYRDNVKPIPPVVREGVADVYAEKNFGIPQPHAEFEKKYKEYKQGKEEQPFGYVKGSAVYKNPKSLKNFDNNVRAIADADGNLYVALLDLYFAHGIMGVSIGIANNTQSIYNNYDKYLLLHRYENTNKFGFSDTTAEIFINGNEEELFLIKDTLERTKLKNPQYDFYMNYYQDFDDSSIEKNEVSEGVADVYAEKKFGIPNPATEFEKQYTSYKRELKQKEQELPYRELRFRGSNQPIYKNPKSLANFSDNVRAIMDFDGNLYVAMGDDDFIHGDMAMALGFTDIHSEIDIYNKLDKYVLLHRYRNTNKFGLADSSVNIIQDPFKVVSKVELKNSQNTMIDILKRGKLKNPQYDFYLEYYNYILKGKNIKMIEENANNISYSAVVLNKESHNKLVKVFKPMIPEGWEIIAHHMTINLGKLKPELKQELDSEVELIVIDYAIDDNVMAVGVEGYSSSSNKPHITIAVNINNGSKPVMSNYLQDWKSIPFKLKLGGIVTEVKQ